MNRIDELAAKHAVAFYELMTTIPADVAMMGAIKSALTEFASGEPVAWMADDGRVVNNHTKITSLPKSVSPSFYIPLYAAPRADPTDDEPSSEDMHFAKSITDAIRAEPTNAAPSCEHVGFWKFDYCHPHNGEYWHTCAKCGERDWFARNTDPNAAPQDSGYVDAAVAAIAARDAEISNMQSDITQLHNSLNGEVTARIAEEAEIARLLALCKLMHDKFVDCDFSAWPEMQAAQKQCMDEFAAIDAARKK